jgi:hypothetical protein
MPNLIERAVIKLSLKAANKKTVTGSSIIQNINSIIYLMQSLFEEMV